MTDQERLDRMDELRESLAWLMCGLNEDGSELDEEELQEQDEEE